MTKRPLTRNVGTVCLGTVLLGVGCTPRDRQSEPAGDRLPFPEQRAPQQGAPPTAAELPEPGFGPLARKTLETPVAINPDAEKITVTPAPQKSANSRERLLSTVSDHTLVVVEQDTREPAANALPAPPQPTFLPTVAANETKEIDPALAPFVFVPPGTPEQTEFERESGVVAAEAAALSPKAGPDDSAILPAANRTAEIHSELAEARPDAMADVTLSTTPDSHNSDAARENATRSTQISSKTGADKNPAPSPEQEAGQNPNVGQEHGDTEPPVKGPTPSLEPASAAASPAPEASTPLQPVAPAEPGEGLAAMSTDRAPESVDVQPAAANLTTSGLTDASTALPEAKSPTLNESQSANPAVTARRSIPPRPVPATMQPQTATVSSSSFASPAATSTTSPVSTAQPAALDPTDATGTSKLEDTSAQTNIPSLASVIPAKRSPIPMVSVTPPVPEAGTPAPANDQAGDLGTITKLPSAKSLVPAPRGQTALGLGQNDPSKTQDGQQLSSKRASIFTASAQPPLLSYQDELILEVQIKGVDASDTIIAYGTREGVYLPLGTLARILDLAITVSDDGHYANGWILDENRTLTLNLRAGTVSQNGTERKLPGSLAAAFDGDLFLRTEAFAEFMPLTVEANLRAQAVIIETLEPFPFQERLAREAERRRLAARGGRREEQDWPRSETPWLLASLPLADVELRGISDRTFGPRVEGDLLLAGDLAFLTAQAYLSGDTKNGLTASLVEVGRQDPDANLLGPLQATDFSIGDVSTISMPVGLRSVFGRGFAVTNTPQEAVSVFERIDLRGILPDGYEVELYRNDILVGSTRDAVNGQYEFLQVPVDFGLNVFRLVFFGPQGQRSEQVRKISVGDGRLPQGKLVYRIGAVQKDQNVFDVRTPNFIPQPDFGTWRATGEIGYGLTSGLTTVLSGAWYQTATDQSRWTASAGIRTSLGGFALKSDVAAADQGGMAFSAGIGGRFGATAVTLSHVEYAGNFIDETRSLSGESLRRATDLDVNSTLNLGNPVTGLVIPLNLRARYLESANGRKQTNAALRASTRLPGMLVSNTLEYTRTSLPQIETFSQLFGNFDLATIGRSKARGRLSLGYQLLPNPELVSAAVEMDYALDEKTALRGSVGYAFQSKSTQFGVSAVRDFDKFTLALDGNYGLSSKDYSIGLRLGFSFGRDPLSGRLFVARPGVAASGGATLRAFKDNDGDGLYGPTDEPMPEVDFVAFNQTAKTDGLGIARLSGLGAGRGVSIQIDSSTLPDIDLAAATEGIEIVPRPGRIHQADFPIVSLSEVEGTVRFAKGGDEKRGVSGVRLQLKDKDGQIASYAKTEVDGYYFFERVKPGTYTIRLDPDQSNKLNLCTQQNYTLSVGFESDIVKRDVDIHLCS